MKLYIYILKYLFLSIFSSIFIFSHFSYAENTINPRNNNYKILKKKLTQDNSIKKHLKIGEFLTINLSSLELFLKKDSEKEILFEWSMKWYPTVKGNILKQKYVKHGPKVLNLNIYSLEDPEKKLIATRDFTFFVYKEISYLIFDKNIWEEAYKQYTEQSRDSWIYIQDIMQLTTKEIANKNIFSPIHDISILQEWWEQYITIWWNKDFLLSIIAKINQNFYNKKINTKFNILLISPLNTDVLHNYLKNFLVNKPWIRTVLLIPVSSSAKVHSHASNITLLEKDLKKAWYEYIQVDTSVTIAKWKFISQFINTLSNKWFSIRSIYLIILIPFLLTYISISKHFIWLSPLWINIPILLTLLFFQIGLVASLVIFLSFILLNLILWKLMSRYTLLYTPKMSFLVIINIIFMIPLIMLLLKYNLLDANSWELLFIILFIIIAEKLISTILSKEFSEYRFSVLTTILFALTSYLFFSLDIIQNILFAYPESIILLIILNFWIWKFTWLRITEYFRFKEIIHDMEE